MLTSLFVFVGGTIFYIFVNAIISKPLTELAGWLWPFLGYKYPFLISKKNVQILKLFIWIISSLNFSWWPKISYVTKFKVNLVVKKNPNKQTMSMYAKKCNKFISINFFRSKLTHNKNRKPFKNKPCFQRNI